MTRCNSGAVHSFETFGTQDGPGIRFVVFLQGCLGRCVYCHNPDTWDLKGKTKISVKDVFNRIEKTIPYMRSSGGGVTVSGGEPLLQADFLIELFKLCKKASIHTCIDTSCFYKSKPGNWRQLVDLTDLFLVDIKAIDEKLHRKITSRDLEEVLCFIDMLEEKKKPYWLRYVLVPGLNNKKEHIKELKEFLSNLKYCKKFEFLPYHTLGAHKWKLLGLKYPLKGIPPATSKDIQKAQALFA